MYRIIIGDSSTSSTAFHISYAVAFTYLRAIGGLWGRCGAREIRFPGDGRARVSRRSRASEARDLRGVFLPFHAGKDLCVITQMRRGRAVGTPFRRGGQARRFPSRGCAPLRGARGERISDLAEHTPPRTVFGRWQPWCDRARTPSPTTAPSSVAIVVAFPNWVMTRLASFRLSPKFSPRRPIPPPPRFCPRRRRRSTTRTRPSRPSRR